MDSLFASPSTDLCNQRSQLRQDIARSPQDIKNLKKKAARRVEASFTVFEKNTAMMLYDASGFRIDFPLQYLSDILKNGRLLFPCHSPRNTEKLYFTPGGIKHR